MAASFLGVCWLTSRLHANQHHGHRWKLSSAELLLTLGHPVNPHGVPVWTLTTVHACFAFCFCFTRQMSAESQHRTSTLPSSILHIIQWVTAGLHLGCFPIQSILSFLLQCENRNPAMVTELTQLPAVDLWTLARQHKMPVLYGLLKYVCIAWLLKVHYVFLRKQHGLCVTATFMVKSRKYLFLDLLESCIWCLKGLVDRAKSVIRFPVLLL